MPEKKVAPRAQAIDEKTEYPQDMFDALEADAGVTGKELAPIAAMAKLFATDMAIEVATDAVQLFGCSGISKDNRIEQYFRDAKVLQVIEGTNQIQRNIIGRHVVKTY